VSVVGAHCFSLTKVYPGLWVVCSYSVVPAGTLITGIIKTHLPEDSEMGTGRRHHAPGKGGCDVRGLTPGSV